MSKAADKKRQNAQELQAKLRECEVKLRRYGRLERAARDALQFATDTGDGGAFILSADLLDDIRAGLGLLNC